MPSDLPSADRILDARGHMCPVPTVKASLIMEEMAPGEVLELQADDSVTKRDLPGWAREMGHTVLKIVEEKSYFRIYLKKRS